MRRALQSRFLRLKTNSLVRMQAASRQTHARIALYMSRCLRQERPRQAWPTSLKSTHRARMVHHSQPVARRKDVQRAARIITRDRMPAFQKGRVYQKLKALAHQDLEGPIQKYLAAQRRVLRPDLLTRHLWHQRKQEQHLSTPNARYPEVRNDRRVWLNGGLGAKPKKQKTRRASRKRKQLSAIVLQKHMLGTCHSTAD